MIEAPPRPREAKGGLVKRTDPRVDAYIAKAAPFARPILEHLRELVHEASPEAEETIKWGAPTFSLDGKILGIMPAFKAHCAFAFWHKEMRKILAAKGAGPAEGRGSLGKIARLADLPPDRVMKGYIRKAAELSGSTSPAHPRPVRRPAADVPVPADLAAALKKNRPASRTFEGFPPGHRKEYIEWIKGAKRDETRKRRLDTAIEWLSEGKKINWRYEKC
jgi:uncharacterized protein YdeI (YjbR/CyaY-like superfamily)